MNKTNQGVLVVKAGESYQPYCNKCTWSGVATHRTIPAAQAAARAHATKDCK